MGLARKRHQKSAGLIYWRNVKSLLAAIVGSVLPTLQTNSANWSQPAQIKEQYRNASILKNRRVVFVQKW
ncbi:MAG: hypothetical protein BWY57_01636 [Betaproteobacteria bacterium ADurb.Bin341]|nr:MAG: hypothetical protein BWY57_01636 [Betaproteobacteria bacterium ADurb.Bin341]